ncbi:transglutaminase domain-containing protein [uncultured Eubacterium sp.]|uniref:transglutaminase domain-containing protein n=1 Tax=uncultured Eubacterium sp. TaxID=165185 RepID=UPI0025973E93|nr:transglutaminase domain-containing protein [uncultured Eubacterium sp.]
MKKLKTNLARILVIIMVSLSFNTPTIITTPEKNTTIVYAKGNTHTYESHLDRLNLPDYAKDFYDSLYANTRGADGCLIDISKNQKFINDFVLPKEKTYGFMAYKSKGKIKASTKEIALQKVINKESKKTEQYVATLQAFIYDHPEVFWLNPTAILDHQTRLKKIKGNNIYKYTYTCYFDCKYMYLNYKYSKKSVLLKAINKRDQLLDKLSVKLKKENNYETVLAITDYLSKKNEYNTYVAKKLRKYDKLHNEPEHDDEYYKFAKKVINANDGLIALEGHKGNNGPVCTSYASAFKMLCDKLNIPCIRITGMAYDYNGGSGGHMWNAVKMDDNNWYNFDATWNDTRKDKHGYVCVGNKTKKDKLRFNKSHVAYHKDILYYDHIRKPFIKKLPKISNTKYKPNNISIKIKDENIIYDGKAKTPEIVVTDKNNNIVNVDSYTVSYENNINPGYGKAIITFNDTSIKQQVAIFAIKPNVPTNISVKGTGENSILSFDNTGITTGYEIQCSNNSNFKLKETSVKYIKTNSIKVSELTKANNYNIRIRSYIRVDGKYIYSDFSDLYNSKTN